MATIDYPVNLPDFKLGKSRQQVQTFRTPQPFGGPLFVEKITDESPVIWNVTIVCKTPIQGRVFQAFLRKIKNGETFNKNILTEEGFIPHEVRFIEMPLEPTQMGVNVWIYSGVIQALKLSQPDALIDDDLIILYLEQGSIIDTAVNVIWPELVPVVNPFARLATPLVHLFTNDKTVEKLTNGSLTTDRATTGTFIDRVDGLLKTASINTIREEAEGYLIEGDSTNLILRSEEFDNAAWFPEGVTVVANAGVSPDGLATADRISDDGVGFDTLRQSVVGVTANTAHTFSVYLKAETGDQIQLALGNTTLTNSVTSIFDLTAGTASAPSVNGSATQTSALIKPLANGWFRCSVSAIVDAASTTLRCGIRPFDGSNTSLAWGAQLEGLPFASSYVKTIATTVTRSLDNVSILAPSNIPNHALPHSILYTVKALGFVTSENQTVFVSFVDSGINRANYLWLGANKTILNYLSSLNFGITTSNDREEVRSICTTYDGSTLKSYSDGSLGVSSAIAYTDADGPTTVFIGRDASLTRNLFGHLSDFMIYDFELTSTEVALLQG